MWFVSNPVQWAFWPSEWAEHIHSFIRWFQMQRSIDKRANRQQTDRWTDTQTERKTKQKHKFTTTVDNSLTQEKTTTDT